MKARVSVDLDTSDFPDYNHLGLEGAIMLVRNSLIAPARKAHIDALTDARRDGGDEAARALAMHDQLLNIKACLMIEANLHAEELPSSHVLSTQLPFGREYQEPIAQERPRERPPLRVVPSS